MTDDVTRFLRSGSASMTPDEALRARPGALIGVSATAESALATININSIFDLAASRVFAAATALLALEKDPTAAESRLNTVPGDVAVVPPGTPVRELANQPINILRGIGDTAAPALAAALDVATVRDLALWSPYQAAKAILAEAFFPEAAAGFDPNAPSDLLPKNGVYPTERVFFKKLVIDTLPKPGNAARPIEEADWIDLTSALAEPAGFAHLATGALLTFSQSWFSQGLTLGQLLHSTSLAPGESTRIAVVDWSRRSRAAATEDISESELLSNTMTHARAVSEVTTATASEFQRGRSSTSATSTTEQSGGGFGLDLGFLGIGGSGSSSTTTTDVMSASSSYGARDLAADYAQQINDSSQQNASSVRNRRASIVREVSQSEHEEISTRVVTNYNHMHALSIHYYEVIQAFRTTTQLERAERCLFVPVKLVDFTDSATVDRWRLLLADAALTQRTRRQLTVEYGVVEVIPQTPRITPGSIISSGLGVIRDAHTTPTPPPTAPAQPGATEAGSPTPQPGTGGGTTVGGATIVAAAGTVSAVSSAATAATVASLANVDYRRAPLNSPITLLAHKGWDLEQVTRIGWSTGRVLVQPGSDSVFVSDDALLVGFSLREGQATRFVVRTHDGHEITPAAASGTDFAFTIPVALTELESIAVQYVGETLSTALVLQLSLAGTVMPLNVPIVLRSISVPTVVVKFGGVGAAGELTAHLEANRLHYTQAILRALDAATVAALLAPFTYRGLPLSQLVDTLPIAVMANYLVFRLNVSAQGETDDERWADEQSAWRSWLARRGLDRPAPRSEVIPLPSGGVFAEAVLGRFNAAEKTDLSRFWNWQDSPIPIAGPEIAPVQAGSRAQPEEVTPGQLSTPVVGIQSPTPLPDAAGIAAIITAVQNGNMFRDMSGMAQTLALAQSALQASAQGATAAGQQAGENLSTVMANNTERMRIAAQLLAGTQAGGTGDGTGGGLGGRPARNVTEEGARLNYARDMDERAAASGESQSAASGVDEINPEFQGSSDVAQPEIERVEDVLFRGQTGVSANERADRLVRDAGGGFAGPGGSSGRRRRRRARNLRILVTFVQDFTEKFQSGDIAFTAYEQQTSGAFRYLWKAGGPKHSGMGLFSNPITNNTIDTGMLRGVTEDTLFLSAAVRFPSGGLGSPTTIQFNTPVLAPKSTTWEIRVNVETTENEQTVSAADAGDASDVAATHMNVDPNLYFRSFVTDLGGGQFRVVTKFFTGRIWFVDEHGTTIGDEPAP